MDASDHDRFEDVGLVRLTTWATAACVALSIATLASLSTTGSHRAAIAMAALTGGPDSRPAVQVATRQPELENDRRSLNEALRLLASDRDRLMTRLGSLERNLEDVTGSIKGQTIRALPERVQEPPPNLDELPAIAADPEPAKPAETPNWLVTGATPWSHAASAAEFPSIPAPAPAPPVRVTALPAEAQPGATVVSRTEFGVDIGSGSDLEEVRYLWNAAKAQHGTLIRNLKPIVVKREDRGKPDYRLVIGPLANAGAAAKLCATLSTADIMCSTRPYSGERFNP